MIWLNFLHFYQPVNQQADILEAIVTQSYRPIFRKLNEISGLNLSVNITGALLELFDKFGYTDLIDLLRKAVKDEKIELTGSCKYHALLPLIPQAEAVRQIKQNEETLKFYFGSSFGSLGSGGGGSQPQGFFPPEMAYNPELPKIIEELGYKWVVADEIANPLGFTEGTIDNLYQVKGTKLKVFFRSRRISNMIMSAVVKDRESLDGALKSELASDGYIMTGMDGETFGHHRIGFENFLFEMLKAKEYNICSISGFLSKAAEKYPAVEVTPIASTWASSKQNIKEGSQFMSWLDKDNVIHKYQWEFINFALNLITSAAKKDDKWQTARSKMDAALASDHLWWASAKPWWGLEMIEDGAFRLLDVVRAVPESSEKDLSKANELYRQILSTAFEWQRTGKIRQMAIQQHEILRIPFKDRTAGKGGEEEGVYWAFIDTMKNLEKEAAQKGEYEKATLWRDAVYKLDKKLDIYDAVNAIDTLRQEIGNEEIEKIIEKYKEKYRDIRGGQPEQRGS